MQTVCVRLSERYKPSMLAKYVRIYYHIMKEKQTIDTGPYGMLEGGGG